MFNFNPFLLNFQTNHSFNLIYYQYNNFEYFSSGIHLKLEDQIKHYLEYIRNFCDF